MAAAGIIIAGVVVGATALVLYLADGDMVRNALTPETASDDLYLAELTGRIIASKEGGTARGELRAGAEDAQTVPRHADTRHDNVTGAQ